MNDTNKMNFKNKIAKTVILISIGANVFGWGENTSIYKNAAIEQMYRSIRQKSIDIPTAMVVLKKGTQVDVAQCFKEEFLTDAQEDDAVSEKRKTQRMMKLIRDVHNQKQISGLTLEVNELVEDVSLEFQNKQEALEAEIQGLFGKKIFYGSLAVIGIATLSIAAANNQGTPAKAIMIGGGATAGIAGMVFLSTLGKENKLRTHIVQVQTMQSNWETSFKK